MGGDLGGLLSTALAIVAVATLAGLGLLRGTVTNLREQLRDEREARTADRTQRAEDEVDHAKFKADAETRIARLESDNATLQRVVTGEVHWVALAARLEDAMNLLGTIREMLTRRGEKP